MRWRAVTISDFDCCKTGKCGFTRSPVLPVVVHVAATDFHTGEPVTSRCVDITPFSRGLDYSTLVARLGEGHYDELDCE